MTVSVAGTASTTRAHSLQQIRFGAATNARIEAGAAPASVGNVAMSIPASASRFSFVVYRVTPGQATTVPFTVIDDRGEWPTFVGGGPNAF